MLLAFAPSQETLGRWDVVEETWEEGTSGTVPSTAAFLSASRCSQAACFAWHRN